MSGFERELLDRAVGCFVGLAVGDALGTTLEFTKRDSSPLHTEMTGGGPFDLEPGQWTDDTAMALALAASLGERGKFDAVDISRRFIAWWREGTYSCTGTCFDIGGATAAALATIERSGNPFGGRTSPTAAGNGSLMRLAPAVLFAFPDEELAVETAWKQSRITHATAQAIDACGVLARILVRSIRTGAPAALTAVLPGDTLHPSVREVAAGAFRTATRDEIASSGYVVDTLKAALWAVHSTDSFEDALVLAVNLADDADTVGAVTGQIAGAIYGASAIPERWLAPLAWRDRIEAAALQLVTL